MNQLHALVVSKKAWLLLASSAFLLECIALYFQYAMGLEPCIMCIYQRTAVLGVLVAGIVGYLKPNNLVIRSVAFIIWGIASIWGFLIAKEHIYMQTTDDPFAFTCDMFPNFPEFMPLHEWVPVFFAATGDCGNIDWEFAGLSMPGWMEVIFAAFSIVFIVTFVTHILTIKKG
ncbi:Periplasmic thiol:disulfide oxidoreductase DsbB,required for DsbA reoxidation [Pseudoalteromonas luteoviolacea B = ATCC 29581]|nr:Periplasmic thiol:disulfide oxidoreductase DsbB,required for DsbA reoxidation [Pseudoalteromonas luteoviolacea B = ATCC 29581]